MQSAAAVALIPLLIFLLRTPQQDYPKIAPSPWKI